MADDEDLVPVREAARLAHVTKPMVHWWIESGKLPVRQGRYGLLVPRSAVRTLVQREGQTTAPREPSLGTPNVVAGEAEYVPPFVAARLAGVRHSTVSTWGRTGKVASRPGPHGRLVRLADVLALVARARASEGS